VLFYKNIDLKNENSIIPLSNSNTHTENNTMESLCSLHIVQEDCLGCVSLYSMVCGHGCSLHSKHGLGYG